MKHSIVMGVEQMVMGIFPCSVLPSLRQSLEAIRMSLRYDLSVIWKQLLFNVDCSEQGTFLSFCMFVWPVEANK